MKKLNLLLVIFLIQIIGLSEVLAQTQIGIPVKGAKSYVLDFDAPFNEMLIDILDNSFSTEEKIVVSITPQTKFLNKKGKTIEPGMIRRGMELSIRGERFGLALTAAEIKVLTDLEKWEVELKGYFENLNGDKAWVDGRTVRLSEGAIVRGTAEWKGKTFSSFSQMMLGSEVEVKKGVLMPDGIIYATEVETRPNIYTRSDQELVLMVQSGMSLPNGISGGVGKVLGKDVKFAENSELQAYVARVGEKVIPQFQKDLPPGDAAKIHFRFMVIEDESFNAFALPDGSIFVHTGLLKVIRNEAQLAGVLGHEIAHVTHEHSRKRKDCWECNLGAGLITSAAASTGNSSIAAGGQLGVLAMINNLGRNAEDQADRVGLLYMYQAGYDPREVVKLWSTISKAIIQDAVATFFYSDHSKARDRVKYLNRELAYSFHDTDLSRAKKGEVEYLRIVGSYFGTGR